MEKVDFHSVPPYLTMGAPGQPFLKQRAGPGPSAQTAGSEPLEALSLPNPAPVPVT